MKPFKNCSYFNLPENAAYEIMAQDSERYSWLFATNCEIPHAAVNYCFLDNIDIEVEDIPRGSLGVSFYRSSEDEDGRLRLVGHKLHQTRPSTSQILSAAKRLIPMIPKSSWKTSKGSIWLYKQEDLLLFQLAYGGVWCNERSE